VAPEPCAKADPAQSTIRDRNMKLFVIGVTLIRQRLKHENRSFLLLIGRSSDVVAIQLR
jgi:hypothetical protein